MPLVQDLRWRATHRSDISRASGLRPHVAMHCCTAGLLHCWPAALLACCTAGLLHCWPAALLAACCTAGLLACCNAAMHAMLLRCCAAALTPCTLPCLSMQLSTVSNHTSLHAHRCQGHRKRKASDAPRARMVGLPKGDRKAKKR